jgi:hypothetical protein
MDEVFSAAEDDTCDFEAGPLCADGLACIVVAEGVSLSTVCAALEEPGSPCAIGGPNSCTAGYYCQGATLTEPGTCALMPQAGDDCDPTVTFGDGGPPIPCDFGATCNADGQCIALKDNGVACDTAAECFSGQCLDGGCSASCVE